MLEALKLPVGSLPLSLTNCFIKRRIVTFHKEDLESSEQRLLQWKNGDVPACERRILFTKWLGRAWEEFTTERQDVITDAFKRCGMYNDIHGKENHLVEIQRFKEYVVPAKNCPPAPIKKKKGKKRKAGAGSAEKKKQKNPIEETISALVQTGVFQHHHNIL